MDCRQTDAKNRKPKLLEYNYEKMRKKLKIASQ